MKISTILTIPIIFFSCSSDPDLKNSIEKDPQEKVMVKDSIDEDNTEGEIMFSEIEFVEYEFDNGPVKNRGSMKILIQNIGLANFSEEGQYLDEMRIKFVQYNEDSILLKPCEYDERGSFIFNIGTQVDHELAFDLYPLPIIEYDNQDPYYYYIEDVFIFEGGDNIELKLKEIHHYQNDYEIDEAEPIIYVNISRSDSKTILDFSNIVTQGHFMLESERKNLPKAECDEDYH